MLDHKEDNPEFAISGKYVLRWTETDDVDHVKRSRKSIPKMTSSGMAINDNNTKRKSLSSTSTVNAMKNSSTPVSATSGSNSRQFPMEKLEKSPMKKGVGGNR